MKNLWVYEELNSLWGPKVLQTGHTSWWPSSDCDLLECFMCPHFLAFPIYTVGGTGRNGFILGKFCCIEGNVLCDILSVGHLVTPTQFTLHVKYELYSWLNKIKGRGSETNLL